MWATREHDGKTGSSAQVHAQHNISTGITPAAPSGYTRGFHTAALGMRDAVLKFRNNPDSPPGLLPVQCLTPNYSIPCDPYLTVTQAATLIPG